MLAIMGMPFDLTVDFFTGAAVLCSGAAFFATKHKERKNKDASDIIEKIFRHTENVVKQLHEYQIDFCNTAAEFYLLKDNVYLCMKKNGGDSEITKEAIKSANIYKDKLVLQAYQILFYVQDGAKRGLSILKGEFDYEGKPVVDKQIEYCDEFIKDTDKWLKLFKENPENYGLHIKNIGELYASLLKAVILSEEHHKGKP